MSCSCSFKLQQGRLSLSSDASLLLLLPPRMGLSGEKGAKDRSHTWELFQPGISRLRVPRSHLVGRETAGAVGTSLDKEPRAAVGSDEAHRLAGCPGPPCCPHPPTHPPAGRRGPSGIVPRVSPGSPRALLEFLRPTATWREEEWPPGYPASLHSDLGFQTQAEPKELAEQRALCIPERPVRVVIGMSAISPRVEVLCAENSQMLGPGERRTRGRWSQECSGTGENRWSTGGGASSWGKKVLTHVVCPSGSRGKDHRL